MRVDLEAIPPARAVESATEVVHAQANNKGVQLQLNIADRGAYELADESRLQQVVWNLLSNAIKFTPPGGRIEVNARVVFDQYEIAWRTFPSRHQHRVLAADF
jgi:signal transduction histidine kinase